MPTFSRPDTVLVAPISEKTSKQRAKIEGGVSSEWEGATNGRRLEALQLHIASHQQIHLLQTATTHRSQHT